MTAAERLSRIGNRVDACRILAEKDEEGNYFGNTLEIQAYMRDLKWMFEKYTVKPRNGLNYVGLW